MYRRITDYEQRSGQPLTVVYPISSLKVLQYGLEMADPGLVFQLTKGPF
jgi:hypothetical protein